MPEQSPIHRARKLRQSLTPEERLLWEELRARRFYGFKFLRQHPIFYQLSGNKQDYFIADFYCSEKKLVVEVDGIIHDYQKAYDQQRDEILANLGLRVLRIRNDEFADITRVLQKIRSHL